MILLPTKWNLSYESFDDDRNYWPIRLMKKLMILPHPDKNWLGFGHTFAHKDDEEFAEEIGFSSVMLTYSKELSNDFTQIPFKKSNWFIHKFIFRVSQFRCEFRMPISKTWPIG